MLKTYSLLLLLFNVCFLAKANNFYFANNGTDKNNGKSVHTAFHSIEKINSLKLNGGDTLFFKRGDTFFGNFEIAFSGTLLQPIVFTAYGNGLSPIISGGIALQNWVDQGNGIVATKVDAAIISLYVNNQLQTLARFPNSGFINIDSANAKKMIFSQQLQSTVTDYTNATARIRSIDWVYEMRRVQSYNNGKIFIAPHPQYPDEKAMLKRSDSSRTTIYNLEKNYGFYVDGLKAFLDSTSEWVQQGNQVFYKPSFQESNLKNIGATVLNTGIVIKKNVANIVIDNLSFGLYFQAGIFAETGIKNCLISNCSFSNIHVNGIAIDSGGNNVIIRNSFLKDIQGKGIILTEASNCFIQNNTVKKIGLVPGYGFSGVNGATGIIINNIETKDYQKTQYSHHNIVRGNKVDSCGYNGIRVDGSYNLVEYNIIDHCGITLNDGSALYCFATMPGVTHHSIFRKNIVLNAKGNNEATPSNDIHFNGIYIDNNSHDMLIEGNTSAHHSSSGIVNNDRSFKNTYSNNIIYNCRIGIGFTEWGKLNGMYQNVVEGNIIVGLNEAQTLVSIVNFLGPATNFSNFSNNLYIHPNSSNAFYRETRQFPKNSKLNLSFLDWQLLTAHDSNSSSLAMGTELLNNCQPILFTNDSHHIKELSLTDTTYKMLDGTQLNTSLKLQPFSSMILLKKIANNK